MVIDTDRERAIKFGEDTGTDAEVASLQEREFGKRLLLRVPNWLFKMQWSKALSDLAALESKPKVED